MEKEFYTVIVADDEPELLDAVCEMIPWNSIGFQLVGRAGNGWDALQLVEQLRPDLLLTDIQMNFISGISLAKQVRELQPLTQIVFLSGYDDFEYAQYAIEYNVLRYLLKPIGMEELTRNLVEIHQKITDIFQHLQPKQQAVADWRATVLSGLLDSYGGKPDRLQFLREGLIREHDDSFWVLAVECSQDISYTVDVVMEKSFCSHSVYSGGRVLTLLAGDSFSKLPAALEELSQAIWRVLGLRCTMGISRCFSSLDDMNSACREAVDAQHLAEPGSIQFVNAIAASEKSGQSLKDAAAALDAVLKTTDREELEVQLPRVLESHSGDSRLQQQILLVQLLGRAVDLLADNDGPQSVEELCRRCGLEEMLFPGQPLDRCRSAVMRLYFAARNRIAEQHREGMSLLCSQALDIISQDYRKEDLSLGAVSERLHVSPNYLSSNMKKYAGDTFINLLTQKRMEVARELLTKKNIRIYEVAQQCGYSDQHYFSFCFKKYFGVSPAQLRRAEQEKAGQL